ncbi:unnamed protein product [Scytosiphon promiscuus]
MILQGSDPGYLFYAEIDLEEAAGDGGPASEGDAGFSVADPVTHRLRHHQHHRKHDHEESGESRLLGGSVGSSSSRQLSAPVEEGRPPEGIRTSTERNEGATWGMASSALNSGSSGGGSDGRNDVVQCRRCQDMQVPLRSHHCRECGLCVATFDHHCKFIGTCIGERNHCRFWWFLLAQTASLLDAFRITMSGFSDGEATAVASTTTTTTFADWASRNALALVSFVCLLPCVLSAVILVATHAWMAASSMTSYECLRGGGGGPGTLRYLEGTRDFDLPFSEGLLGNLRGFCCTRAWWWWPFRSGHAAGASSATRGKGWRPRRWRLPDQIDRDSEDWRSNLWENKYWSCC